MSRAIPFPSRETRVVIIGGGFGGLNVAKGLCRAPCEVILVDQKNHHLFQPLLYQVATASLSPAEIAVPLRHVLSNCRNVEVVLGEVVDVDLDEQRIKLAGNRSIRFDKLVIATGSTHSYFSHEEWENKAPGLKTIEDSIEIRKRILLAFEEAENREYIEGTETPIQFVIVGAGPTGVEMAGAIAELAQKTLVHDYRKVNTRSTQVTLVEGLDRVLPTFAPKLSEKAQASLEKLGVRVLLNTLVTRIEEGKVYLKSGEVLNSHTVIWAAGVKASPAGKWLNAVCDRAGRVVVDPMCRVPSHPNVFVIGDSAHFEQDGRPLPGVASVAIQQGNYVARSIRRELAGQLSERFRYADRGSLATIGRNMAIADFGRLKFSGFLAWILWATVHILYLVGFRNRVWVFFSLAWSYLNFHRGARLITHTAPRTSPAENIREAHPRHGEQSFRS